MLRLRKTLLSKKIYIIIFVVCLLTTTLKLTIFTKKSVYKEGKVIITGIITDLSKDDDYIKFEVYSSEVLLASYYDSNFDFNLGDKVLITGELKKPLSTYNFNSFSYEEYLKNKQIFYILEVEKISLVEKNKSLLNKLKIKIRNHISSFSKSEYLNTFIIGKKDELKKEVKTSFQKLGISHLFALSGTHISLLLSVILNFLTIIKIKGKKRLLLSSICLLSYYLLIDASSSIERALVFNLVFSLNKEFNFFIPPFYLIITSLAILLFINPYYIFDLGFKYSSVIASGLIIYSYNKSSKKNYLKTLLETSFISFIISIPISLSNFYYLNFLSIIYNLFYVPYITLLLFPLTFLSFIIPFLEIFINPLVNFLETSVLFLSKFTFLTLTFKKVSFIFYLLYFLIIITFIFTKKKKYLVVLCLFLLGHYLLPNFDNSNKLYMLDVGQGDSFLLKSKDKTMLIDTGGSLTSLGYIKDNTISFLKSIGIKKLDIVLITHGDMDHAGEALGLIDEVHVDNIFINSNSLNYLEKNLIKKASKKDISVTKLLKDTSFTLGDYHFLVLNSNLLDENSSSIVLYITINKIKMLFMGDASVKTEKEILEEYELPKIDILKVGHHGSRTSSSIDFLSQIKPKYSLISSGIDNRFNHPHQEVVNNLLKENSIIINTKDMGMAIFDFDKLSYKTFKTP